MRLFVFLFVLLAVAVFAQSRADSFDASGVAVTSVLLSPLPDGGCVALACGESRSLDGGAVNRECVGPFDLKATVNVNRCNGLATSLVPRVMRALRFDVDGGAP